MATDFATLQARKSDRKSHHSQSFPYKGPGNLEELCKSVFRELCEAEVKNSLKRPV